MKDFIESIIATGNYVLSEMEERIQKMYVMGKITEEDMTYLLNLAANSADDSLQINIVAKLAELEARIAKIESDSCRHYIILRAFILNLSSG